MLANGLSNPCSQSSLEAGQGEENNEFEALGPGIDSIFAFSSLMNLGKSTEKGK
jgi:hypothetical protein